MQVGVLEWEDAAPFMALFEKLRLECRNTTGKLTKHDLQVIAIDCH